MQADPAFYGQFYGGDKQLRMARTTLTYTTKMDVAGLPTPLKITDVFVIPASESDERRPWILMSYTVQGSPGDITSSGRRDVCHMLDVEYFISTLGMQQSAPEKCNLNSMFETMRQSALVPLVLQSTDIMSARIFLLPTSLQAAVDACILTLKWDSILQISEIQFKECFNTPNEFLTGANFPTRPGNPRSTSISTSHFNFNICCFLLY